MGVRRALAGVCGLVLLLAGCATTQAGGDGGSSGGSPGGASSSAPTSPDDPVSSSSGTPSPSTTPTPSAPATDPGTLAADLTVTLDETGSGPVRTWHLTCAPAGGDHPDPAGACAALVAAGGASALQPASKDAVCTEQYGGPQKAHVEGTVAGEPVRADFDRTNGCGIGRWDPLAPLLGTPGGAGL